MTFAQWTQAYRAGAPAFVLLAALIPLDAVRAQTATPDATQQLEEITVTARKRPERLWDVPFSVDAITSKQLEATRSLETSDALRNVEGVSIGTQGDRTNGFVVLRGVGPVYSPLSPDNSSVITFVDGAPLSIAASNSAYLDLERVEVLKGPQSTLFGRNTTGGAINLIPVLPSHVASGYLRGEYGTDNVHRIEGAVGGSIIPDVLAGRFVFRRSGADGYIDNAFGPKLGADSDFAGRASLLYTPNESTKWLLSFSGEHANNVPVQFILNAPDWLKLAGQNLAQDKRDIAVANSKFEHTFDHFVFTSQTSFSTFKSTVPFNAYDFFIAGRQFGMPAAAFSDPATNFGLPKRDESRLSQELRLSSLPDVQMPWLVGAVYYRDPSKREFPRAFWPYGAAGGGNRFYDNVTNGQAVFGEITYPVIDRLKLTLGGRLAHEDKTYSNTFVTDGTPGQVPFFVDQGKLNYNFWTGRSALSYEWSERFMTFGSVSRGYKTGGFPWDNSLDWAGIPAKPYESSTIITYEIGARASLLNNKLQLQGALFLNDIKKEQVMSFDYMSLTTQNLNIDVRSAGFELGGKLQVTSHWDISAGITYTSAELRNVTAELVAAQPGIQDGNRLPYVPEWAARTVVGYRAPGSELGFTGPLASKTIFGRVSYNYIGEQFTDAANFGKIDPAHIVSTRFGIDWGGGEAYVFGENLLNKKYMTANQPYGQAADGTPLFGATYARGAVVGVGAAVRF